MSELTDVEFLVQETFKLQGPQLDPEQPGVIFRLKQIDQMAKVNCIGTDRVKEDREQLINFSPSETNDAHLGFFLTDSFQEAHLISQQFDGYKTALSEQIDLGSVSLDKLWWIGVNGKQVILQFRGVPRNCAEKVLQLGPLGDSSIAIHYFSWFKKFNFPTFAISDVKNTEKKIDFSFKDEKSAQCFFEMLGNPKAFIQSLKDFEVHPQETIEYLSLLAYLSELHLFHRFWLDLDAKLAQLKSRQNLLS